MNKLKQNYAALCGFDKISVALGIPAVLFCLWFGFLHYQQGNTWQVACMLLAGFLIGLGNVHKLTRPRADHTNSEEDQ